MLDVMLSILAPVAGAVALELFAVADADESYADEGELRLATERSPDVDQLPDGSSS
jgi:hypothetical protein